jgi:hypothetical protein
MEFATWAYPWDVLDEGARTTAEQLRELGIGEINLATNYHAVQTFSPRNPDRKTHFAHASSYFQPDERYGTLAPTPYEAMDADWVTEITRQIEGLRLTSWTIGCHNSRLGMANPDVTLESPFGDDLVFGLCPSHPAVQTYLRGLVGDLAEREEFDRIELETFDYFYGTGFGWHHQKIHADLGTLGEFLFGLCFCEHCRENAAAADVEVSHARDTAVNTIEDLIAGRLPTDTSPDQWLREHPEISAYVDVREDVLADLYADLAVEAGGTPLGYYVGMPEPGQEWMVGADLDRIADHVDYYCLPAYESSREAVLDSYRTLDAFTPDIPLHVGLLPGYPPIRDGATVSDIIDGLRRVDTPRVSFYNYGLLPEKSLDWIKMAI